MRCRQLNVDSNKCTYINQISIQNHTCILKLNVWHQDHQAVHSLQGTIKENLHQKQKSNTCYARFSVQIRHGNADYHFNGSDNMGYCVCTRDFWRFTVKHKNHQYLTASTLQLIYSMSHTHTNTVLRTLHSRHQLLFNLITTILCY